MAVGRDSSSCSSDLPSTNAPKSKTPRAPLASLASGPAAAASAMDDLDTKATLTGVAISLGGSLCLPSVVLLRSPPPQGLTLATMDGPARRPHLARSQRPEARSCTYGLSVSHARARFTARSHGSVGTLRADAPSVGTQPLGKRTFPISIAVKGNGHDLLQEPALVAGSAGHVAWRSRKLRLLRLRAA